MGKYIVIHKQDFLLYKVRHVPVRAKLILAYCMQSGEEWFVANVIQVSFTEHNVISLIRLAKEKNESLYKQETPAV